MSTATKIPRNTTECPPQHFQHARQMDEATLVELEEMAFRYGRGYDSYLAMDLDREYFWCSGRRGVLGFVRKGRYAFVIGGLLSPPEAWGRLLSEFIEFARAKKQIVMFHNIDEAQLPAFQAQGFEVTKVGEETTFDLQRRTWQGKEFAWVRRQSNYCSRQGLVCSELRREDVSEEEWARLSGELHQVSKDFLRNKPQGGQMRFFVSRFDPENLWRRRLFLARSDHGRGRVEGFIICNPCLGGQLWAVEMYRQRRDATRGVVPFLMHQTFQLLRSEGATQASLCIVPALRCEEPMPGDSKLLRWFLAWAKHLGSIYDVQGLYHFKSRFRPEYQNCYLAAYPRTTLLSLRAILVVWRIDRVNPLRIAKRIMIRCLKRESRRSLAQPDSPPTPPSRRQAA